VASPIGVGNVKEKAEFILLFLDEKKQKSTDGTEFTKNPKLTLKHFYSAYGPTVMIPVQPFDMLRANG
jgi:hypothetical protein